MLKLMKQLNSENLLVLLRICLGFVFLWAFLDKLLGLGFATKVSSSWVNGVSPTAGFLKFGTEGPLTSLFSALSGNIVIDILFMVGLLCVGVSLILGIGTKIAGWSGSLMMALIYLSLFPPENNPLIDEHVIYIVVLLIFANSELGRDFSLYSRWRKSNLARKYPLLA